MKRQKSLHALLINPWVYDFACYDLFSKPIGLLSIASRLKRLRFKVDLIDCLDRLNSSLANLSREESAKSLSYGCGNYYSEVAKKPKIFKDIPRYYKRYGMPPKIFRRLVSKIDVPDIILVTSGMTYWYKGVCEAIGILKDRFPKTPLLLGGIYATLCHEHATRYSGADNVFKGADFRDMLRLISQKLNKDLDFAPGYFRGAYELYPKLHYVSLRTSSGCPFKCSYCGWYLLNPRVFQRSPDNVCREIEYFYKRLNIRNFAFYDDALLYNPESHIIKILKAILKRKISAHFHTPNGLHAKFLTKDVALLLKRTGFAQPRLGFESADSNRQISTGAKVTTYELERAVKFLKEAGYASSEIGVYLLTGLPDQSAKEIEDSIYFVHKLNIRVYLEEYSPVPGTVDYKISNLDKDIDPLMHNNSTFPLYNPNRFLEFQKLKSLNHKLNKDLFYLA